MKVPNVSFRGISALTFDYLLKGKVDEKWDALADRIMKQLDEDREKTYRVMAGDKVVTISMDDIIYVYKAGNYCHFVLMGWQNDIAERKPMWKLEEDLKLYKYFINAKRSHMINIRRVREYRVREVIMENGDAIPIGRMQIDRIKDKVMEYMGAKVNSLW